MTGQNLAIYNNYGSYKFANESTRLDSRKPCIFLSHISVDKDSVIEIGEYIKNADIDIYLDIHDEDLQKAVRNNDANKITEFVEKGISKSTHLMSIITNKTKESWWVPYEIGYAKKSDKKISSLKIKGEIEIPPYLKINKVLYGINSLNSYLKEVSNKYIYTSNNREDYIYQTKNARLDSLLESKVAYHPLGFCLDWNQ